MSFNNRDESDSVGNDDRSSRTKVPVNEDYLFDVDIEKRELEPAYWLGPVYEVRRGSWFFSEAGTLRACDENLANQLEEGYLKIAPWQKPSTVADRAVSQPRGRPRSAILESVGMSPKDKPISDAPERQPRATTPELPPTYRLFGAHMNTTVTYQDANVAYLLSDDFTSRVSSMVYGKFGALSGTKVVRGYSELGKPVESVTRDIRRRSGHVSAVSESNEGAPKPPAKARPSMLERQISSLAGLADTQPENVIDEEEEAREVEEKEMEASKDTDGEEQGRKINHLILVTHGIGQRLGLRLDSINFVHDINILRKTIKAVYGASPDLQALNESPTNCGVQVLPICWRHLLDFPQQNRRQTRREQDLADPENAEPDDAYPSLQDITVEGVPYVRSLTSDLVLDILLYQSAYREHIAKIVQKEVQRVLDLFRKRTGFDGPVSLCGHSLGSAILFDILCRQDEKPRTTGNRYRGMSYTTRDAGVTPVDLHLDFDCEHFFCLGSPIALFQMLKGRTIAARQSSANGPPPPSPFDPEMLTSDPFSQQFGSEYHNATGALSITTSTPKCAYLYNIFHPTDPIAYRLEPLISPAMAALKPQELPFTKKGLFAAPGLGNIYDRVGQQVLSGWYSLTSNVASGLINRSLGVTGDEMVLPQDRIRPGSQQSQQNPASQATPQSTPRGVRNTAIAAKAAASAALSRSAIAEKTNKQQKVADSVEQNLSSGSDNPDPPPTLIDNDIETLYSGFQRNLSVSLGDTSSSKSSDGATTPTKETVMSTNPNPPPAQPITVSTSTPPSTSPSPPSPTTPTQCSSQPNPITIPPNIAREDAKVRALNPNGRVDYSIQEGMFDVSLLASIASHLSYWADEDVVHFMVGQVLKRGAKGAGTGASGERKEGAK